jgi:hypothetical protein
MCQSWSSRSRRKSSLVAELLPASSKVSGSLISVILFHWEIDGAQAISGYTELTIETFIASQENL